MDPNLRKNLVSIILTVLILAGGALLSKKMSSQKQSTVTNKPLKKERRTVQFTTYSATEAANALNIDGRLTAHDRVSISSKVQGILQETGSSIRAGRYYAKGDVLFVVDQAEASLNLKAQRSSMMSSITQLMPDLKFDYPASFDAWNNYLRSMKPEQTLKPLPEPVNDQEKFFISGRNIYNQYYTIKSAETRLRDYTIYSPFSGIVTAVNVFPGALVTPGQSLATMINTATYELVAPVELSDLKYIKTGQKVELSSEELGKSWTGKISRISSVIDQNTQNLPVYISVSGVGLRDGMYLNGTINASKLSDVVELPKSAFVTPTSIYVIQDSTIVAKEVTTVKRLDATTLVKGLTPDDRVVTSSLSGLFDGQKVNY